MNKNNKVFLEGEIASAFEYSHKIYGEKFYVSDLAVERNSGVIDYVPIIISERLIDEKRDYTFEWVTITGEFRSYNRYEGDKRRLILSVFVKEFSVFGDTYENNKTVLDGYLCSAPVYRQTPLGREIADFMIAVNRSYGKSDYIPCICWGRDARFVSGLNVGTHIQITGRIQSREYIKPLDDGEVEQRTAYEVSASLVEVLE